MQVRLLRDGGLIGNRVCVRGATLDLDDATAQRLVKIGRAEFVGAPAVVKPTVNTPPPSPVALGSPPVVPTAAQVPGAPVTAEDKAGIKVGGSPVAAAAVVPPSAPTAKATELKPPAK